MKRLITAAIALALLGSTAAIAQPYQRSDHHQSDHRPSDHGQMTTSWNNNGDSRNHQADNRYYSDHPHWSRGDRLSNQYQQRQYVVSDWRANHLRRPSRGHHWVRVNNQFVLVAIGSGLIADAIINSR
ncbi:MAG: RcnB family protein [Alphaproteobacteria bacterium]|nr:RcnB family protein [Alphaproteobacteria bacterium]MDE1987791.1 RcnB family protein [Alphaproteobacteria bacterium]